MQWTGKQLKQLHEALLSAFPNIGALRLFAIAELDENLGSITTGNNLSEIALDLIEWGRARGRLEELVQKAYYANSGNPELRGFAAQFLSLPAMSTYEREPTVEVFDEKALQGQVLPQVEPLSIGEETVSTFWLHGPIPTDHPTAIIRNNVIESIAKLIDTMSSYAAVYAARQTGKTSLLYHFMAGYSDRYLFVFLDFQSWGEVDIQSFYARFLRQLAGSLRQSAEWLLAATPQNAPEFQEALRKAGRECPKERLVILCDELGGLQPDVALAFANAARSLFTQRLQVKDFAKISFVFAGGTDLGRLTGRASPIYNILTRYYLEDFDVAEVERIAAACFLESLSQEVYTLTGGHPYLTQLLLSYTCPHGENLSLEEALDRVLQEGDPCVVNALKQLEGASESAKATAKRIFEQEEVRFSRTRPQIAELELIGLIKRGPSHFCVPRNEIFEFAFRTHTQMDQVDAECRLLTDSVPTGCYRNLTREEFPLVQLDVENPTEAPVTISASAIIPDYSLPDKQTCEIPPLSRITLELLPLLTPNSVSTLNEITPHGLHVTVKRLDSEVFIHDEFYRIMLHARDTALLAIIDPQTFQVVVDLVHHLCAWVTPHARGIDEILQKAGKRHPNGALVGYQGAASTADGAKVVRQQVKAIYQTLQLDTKLGYIESSMNLGANADQVMQRVKLPSRTLDTGSANCIDGTVLFASLFECLGLNPVLVIVPNHAYVGWEVWPLSSQYEYLETTWVGSRSFEDARSEGFAKTQIAQTNGDKQRPLFDPSGFWHQVDVKEYRQQRILPIE